jgi:hypothetical protein
MVLEIYISKVYLNNYKKASYASIELGLFSIKKIENDYLYINKYQVHHNG